jgi:DNA-binding HxlR family transcriptional regulator
MQDYGQFCPIAQAAEVLTERWTPLVLRELALTGSRRFNDIQRGVPLMSSSLLTKRLRQLERAGIVERKQRLDGKGTEYHLTAAGQELGPLMAQMGIWSERWLRRPIFEKTPDTGLLMWWVRGTVKGDELPAGRTVIHFRFSGAPEKLRYFWLVLPESDLCLSDPGFGVDVTVDCDAKSITAVWMGDLELAAALNDQAIRLEGRRDLVRSFPKWFGLHPLFAGVEHPATRPRVTA